MNERTIPTPWGGTAVVAQPLDRDGEWAGIEYEEDMLRAVCVLGGVMVSSETPRLLGAALIELYWKHDCEIERLWTLITMHGGDPYDRDWSTDYGVGPEVEWVYVLYPRGLAIVWREEAGVHQWWRAWVPWSEDPMSDGLQWEHVSPAEKGS